MTRGGMPRLILLLVFCAWGAGATRRSLLLPPVTANACAAR